MSGKLLHPSGKRKTILPVRANVGIEKSYAKRIDALIDEMQTSLLHWLGSAYKANEPATALAMDRSVSDILNALMKQLAKRWLRRFDKLAASLAEQFTKQSTAHADAGFKAALRKGGLTVKFQTTAAQQDAVAAVLNENIGLIKSIGAQHLEQVGQAVQRAAALGRDLKTLTDDIERIGGVSRRRAAFIARDQSNKATAVIIRTRQAELGITKAEWRHSTAGRHPRPEHVKANGKEYDVAKGMFLEGVWTWPGVEINCRCVSKSIIPGL